MVKNLPAMQETQIRSLGREDPLEEETATHSSILNWRIHGQRSLVGHSPYSPKELDMTERAQTQSHGWFQAPVILVLSELLGPLRPGSC